MLVMLKANDMRVCLLGFGNVGRALVELLALDNHGLQLVGVVTHTRGSLHCQEGLDPSTLATIEPRQSLGAYPEKTGLQRDLNLGEWLEPSKVDTLVDATPTLLPEGQPALSWCQRALEQGIDLVLANKGPLVANHSGLIARADQYGGRLLYEATVLAGTPVFSLIRHGLTNAKITKARGILNGTCNFILSKMETGLSYRDALAEAQERGYAEADPTADVDGWDTAVKLVILSKAIFDTNLSLADIHTRGIRDLSFQDIQHAKRNGKRWKLLGTLDERGARVAPTILPLSDPIANVMATTNALSLHCRPLGDVFIQGPGAGGKETAFGILRDLSELQSLRRSATPTSSS